MNQRKLALIIGAVILAVFCIGGPLYISINEKQVPEQAQPTLEAASASAKHFLDAYVEPDGRVVRRDQGGDTVSEGQAYAMLVAVATDDKARFDMVWSWSKANLRQPSGLLAWKYNNGAITDASAATDADLDVARALTVAGRQFKDPTYTEEAKEVSIAIMANLTTTTSDGKPVLVAGPWARTAPFYVNPSYESPRSFQELALLNNDSKWTDLANAERARMDSLIITSDSSLRLPPDWATVATDGKTAVAPAPGGTENSHYAYDAVRTPIRLAESCNSADVQQAAKLWTILNKTAASKTSAGMTLTGSVIDQNRTAVGAVAAAAGAKAAGDTLQQDTLLAQADSLEAANTTYYGAAWAALGRIMLTTNWLGTCPS